MGTRHNSTYFLARGWDYPSDSILLGSIITDPSQPELVLFKPSTQDDNIKTSAHTTEKSNPPPSFTPNGNHDNKPGLFGTFLNQYGLGNEESVQYDRTSVRAYSFQQIRSRSFQPSEEFIARAVAGAERVSAFLRKSEDKTPLYMITGVKSVFGAGMTAASSKGPGWQISVTPGAAPGPLDASSSSVVYAFQVTELSILPDTKVSTSPVEFTAGLGLGGKQFVRDELDKKFGAATFMFMEGFDEEQGTPCQIIAPSLTAFDILTASSARTDPEASLKWQWKVPNLG